MMNRPHSCQRRTTPKCSPELSNCSQRFDESLIRTFAARPLGEHRVDEIVRRVELAAKAKTKNRQYNRIIRFAIAASLIGVAAFSIWIFASNFKSDPFFEPRPLVAIYQETVGRGFKPYYECHDMERFAKVFAQRQKQPLTLKPLADGSRMLGLSYLGGLSRETTAMLAEVDGQAVIVFVDRITNDQPEFGQSSIEIGINVFREKINGLVFYEVSPFPKSRLTSFFEFLD